MKWCNEKNATSVSERTVLAYFLELSKKSKPSTLWAYYSMLRTTIKINGGSVDIGTYPKLMAYLKRISVGYQPKKARVFTEDELKTFLSSAPDCEWLAVKVRNNT